MNKPKEPEKVKPNIYQRINAIMAEVEYVLKETKKVNNAYRFVSHDAVAGKMHKQLVKHGIVVTVSIKNHNKEFIKGSVFKKRNMG